MNQLNWKWWLKNDMQLKIGSSILSKFVDGWWVIGLGQNTVNIVEALGDAGIKLSSNSPIVFASIDDENMALLIFGE